MFLNEMLPQFFMNLFLIICNALCQPLGNMLIFHYLVNVLESDFLPRKESYRGKLTVVSHFIFPIFLLHRTGNRSESMFLSSETLHWPTVKDSQLNFLLVIISLSVFLFRCILASFIYLMLFSFPTVSFCCVTQ